MGERAALTSRHEGERESPVGVKHVSHKSHTHILTQECTNQTIIAALTEIRISMKMMNEMLKCV